MPAPDTPPEVHARHARHPGRSTGGPGRRTTLRLGFRSKVFLAVFGVATVIVLVASVLLSLWLSRQTYDRVERTLVAEARLMADMLSRMPDTTTASEIVAEADRLGRDLGARVTLIAADGRVLGDSSVSHAALGELENHSQRPEVIEARQRGLGVAERPSHTLGEDLLYVAARVDHGTIAVARLALPLTEVQQQLSAVRHVTLLALGIALASAVGLALLSSTLLARRVHAIADVARRYAAGDLSGLRQTHEDDELGTVAAVLDETVRSLGNRLAELAQDRARMDAILSGMQEGVLMVDSRGRVQLLNRAAREMLRLEEDAVLDRPYIESIRHPEVVALIGAALERQQGGSLELAPGRNPERALVGRVAPVSMPGGDGAVLVLHDMTDLRRADQVRRDFVANVSHELRTPLTAIRGYVEALGDDPLDPAERQRFLEIVARHTERMERLVKDLLRLARLEARQEPVEPGWHSLDAIVGSAVTDLSPAIEGKQQQVHVRVDPNIGLVITDAAKLQDAVRNIVENAIAYAPEGTRVHVEAVAQGTRVVITVADEGPGIPEHDLGRIFERFYRVDKARSRESGGTGLGLSIVKHLVERLSGDVWAANRPEGGAIFTIVIPREMPPDAT